MSRHLPHRPRITPSHDNPYQLTTVDYPHPHTYKHKNGYISHDPRLAAALYRNQQAYIDQNDTCFSEDTYSESQYDYYQDTGYQTGNKKDSRTDYTYSDDSESTRLPYYESEEPYVKRQSRNTSSDRSSKRTHFQKEDSRKMYANQENICDLGCYESGGSHFNDVAMIPANLPRRLPLSRVSDRPQSSQSSSITSAVVHGCGGRCQTFENVCYYFLQVAFTMGILIGVPLSIAGAVLRKSAARNLQVLVYIGAMLSLVSALLLTVQCNAKRTAKNRKKALKNAKRAPIVLEPIPPKPLPYQQQPLIDESQRALPVTIIPMTAAVHQIPQRRIEQPPILEQQGVPWWRRKDLVQNR